MSEMQEKLQSIHSASMEIISSLGMEFNDDEILELAKSKGIKVEDNRIFFTEEQLMEYVNKAPSEFTIHSRNNNYNMSINTNSRNYSPGYGCSKIREWNGEVRNAVLDDFIKFSKMTHASDLFSINGGILAQPNDIESRHSSQIMAYTTIKNSDKCIFTAPSDKEGFEQVVNIVNLSFGDIENKNHETRMITLINTLSPLKMDKNAIDCIKISCKNNQAVIITPAPMLGSTAPITIAGLMAMSNSECLSAIAVTQMLNPGNPVIYGNASISVDMKSAGLAMGSPEYSLLGKYSANLAKKYNLPCRTLGTPCDANGVTVQAGYESMLHLYTAHEQGVNFIMLTAGLLDSVTTMSYEKFISDLEIMDMMNYYSKDIIVDEKTLAVDVIKEVVRSNKTFLEHKHTVKRCRKEPWKETIALRGKLNISETPDALMKKSIDNQLNKLLDKYVKPVYDDKINESLRNYMVSIGVDEKVLDKIN